MTEALVARVADALDDIVRMRSLGAPVSAG
jgi:hypothetical protein